MITPTVWDERIDQIIDVFKDPYMEVLQERHEPKEEPTLDFWNDDTWNEQTDEPFRVGTPKLGGDPLPTDLASQRAADIHGLEPAPTADQRAADIHGKIGKISRSDLFNAATKRVGGEYEWGGTTKATGWDCSGLIYRIFLNHGITTVPRTSGEIIEHATPISLAKAKKTKGAVLWHEGHIAISAGDGVHTVEAMGEAYGVVKGLIGDRFTRGGILPETPTAGTRPKKNQKVETGGRPRSRGRSQFRAIDLISGRNALASSQPLTFATMSVAEDLELARRGATEPEIRGAGTDKGLTETEIQMRRGFLKAGRPDLARMVGTSAFNTWLGQESGMDPGAVSPPNNKGLRNDGLFQVWRGHAFNSEGQFSRYSAQKQARLVATYFPHLSPDLIRSYAQAIAKGLYEGWS